VLPPRRPVDRPLPGRIVVRDCPTTTSRRSVSHASAGSVHSFGGNVLPECGRYLRESAACCPADYGRSCFGNNEERNVTGHLTGELLSNPARNLTDATQNSRSGCRKDSSGNSGPSSSEKCLRDCPHNEGPDDVPDNFADYSGSNHPDGGVGSQPQTLRPKPASGYARKTASHSSHRVVESGPVCPL
jgi:hypothetical protein